MTLLSVDRVPAPRTGRPTRRPVVTVTGSPAPADLDDWARLVDSCADGDVAQRPEWARVRAAVGFRARWVLVRDGVDGRLLGGAQVLERSVPLLGPVGYVPRGPVLAPEPGVAGSAGEVRRLLGEALTGLARTRLRMLFVAPPPGQEAMSAELRRRGFTDSDAAVSPGQTLRLDLSSTPEQLRAGLSRRLRTWTNRWDSRGVTVREGTAADVPLLAGMVARSGEHQGFAAVSADYLAVLHRELGERAVLFVGQLHGRPVAAALFTRTADALTLRFAGMDRDPEVARQNVPAAVQWHAIGWARSAGLRRFDFGGISEDTARALAAGRSRDTLRGVDRFKAGFGGEVHRCAPAVELVANPLLRAGYHLARRTRAGQRLVELAKRVLRTGSRSAPSGSGALAPVPRPVAGPSRVDPDRVRTIG